MTDLQPLCRSRSLVHAIIESVAIAAVPTPPAEQHRLLRQLVPPIERSETLVVRLPVALVQISHERTGRCQQRFCPAAAHAKDHPIEPFARKSMCLRPALGGAERCYEPEVRRLVEDDALHAQALRFSLDVLPDTAG